MVQSILPETFKNDVFLTMLIFDSAYSFVFFCYFLVRGLTGANIEQFEYDRKGGGSGGLAATF